MTQLEQLSKRLMEASLKGTLSSNMIEEGISFLWQDATKLIKNINETSTGASDRGRRIIEFESNFGLSKTHIF